MLLLEQNTIKKERVDETQQNWILAMIAINIK